MVKRIRPTNFKEKKKGPGHGPGRPKGERGMNKMTRKAIELGRMTGKLPRELLLEWCQVGIITMPDTELYVETVEVPATRPDAVDDDGEPTDEAMTTTHSEVKRRTRLDEHGNPIMVQIPLNVGERLEAAKGAAPYFHARVMGVVGMPPPTNPSNDPTMAISVVEQFFNQLAATRSRLEKAQPLIIEGQANK